jgi:hypothetical protein
MEEVTGSTNREVKGEVHRSDDKRFHKTASDHMMENIGTGPKNLGKKN